ncbi:copper resistance protein NlpE [Botryobacter ruber]|uniref:copper resistance protein NlpE n=1 Tax=Botryobacter ruber TaxID=2171629 RepID=UPI000E0AAB06|nr:copper resistance protein NlpE [Botryobacter ruber]
MLNTLISVLTATVLFTGGAPVPDSHATAAAVPVVSSQTKAGAIPAGRYVGTIPCADCEGIKMELTLKDTQGNQSRSFNLKQTYLGKTGSNATTEISGIWFVATGNKQDPKAVVLQLIPSSGLYDPSYFMLVNKTQLRMLDQEQNEINSKLNYTLRKQ